MIKENIRGLKYVHIGGEAWACGRVRNRHMVIYSPDHKQFDVYDKDVDFIYTELDEYGDLKEGHINHHGNNAIQQKLKIYILTSILDKKENWCFDLKSIPDTKYLKVIYHNGTIKNIDFNGIFESTTIPVKYFNVGANKRVPFTDKKIHPIGYRLCNIQ
jgi:hypothetical protein